MPKEWHKFVNHTLSKKYRSDNYDVLEHNCNCFTNDGVHFLTGWSIPQD